MKTVCCFLLVQAVIFLFAPLLFSGETEKETLLLEGPHKQMKVEPPTDLLQFLEKKFPGFRIANEKDYCKNFSQQIVRFAGRNEKWSYGLVRADFDGNGKEDYSVIIRFKHSYHWLAALTKVQPGISSYEITDFGEPLIPSEFNPQRTKVKGKICDGALIIGEANELTTTVETKKRGFREDINVPLNPFPYVGIESDGSAIQYYWKDGKWIQTGFEP